MKIHGTDMEIHGAGKHREDLAASRLAVIEQLEAQLALKTALNAQLVMQAEEHDKALAQANATARVLAERCDATRHYFHSPSGGRFCDECGEYLTSAVHVQEDSNWLEWARAKAQESAR